MYLRRFPPLFIYFLYFGWSLDNRIWHGYNNSDQEWFLWSVLPKREGVPKLKKTHVKKVFWWKCSKKWFEGVSIGDQRYLGWAKVAQPINFRFCIGQIKLAQPCWIISTWLGTTTPAPPIFALSPSSKIVTSWLQKR